MSLETAGSRVGGGGRSALRLTSTAVTEHPTREPQHAKLRWLNEWLRQRSGAGTEQARGVNSGTGWDVRGADTADGAPAVIPSDSLDAMVELLHGAVRSEDIIAALAVRREASRHLIAGLDLFSELLQNCPSHAIDIITRCV